MNKVIIVTVPLVCIDGEILWGVYEEHSGKKRKVLKERLNAGKQIVSAFEQACLSGSDIVIVVDDKFNTERVHDCDPSEEEIDSFLKKNPLPKTFLEILAISGDRILKPDREYSCSSYTFSEMKLFKKGRDTRYFGGECSTEWAHLLDILKNKGYEEVEAYIPKVCYRNICYVNNVLELEGCIPITVHFTQPTQKVSP